MATITVTSAADVGAGTLRQAILDAAAGDTIVFDAAIFPAENPASISLASGLTINKKLTIDGTKAGVVLSSSNDNVIITATAAVYVAYLTFDVRAVFQTSTELGPAVFDATTFNGAAEIWGPSAFNGDAEFKGAATFSGITKFDAGATFAQTAKFGSAATFNGAAAFAKTVEFRSTASFVKTSEFGGPTAFAGAAEFGETATFADSVEFADVANFAGNATFAQSVEFGASPTFGGTVDFQGAATFADSVAFGGAVDFAGNATFAQSAEFAASPTFGGTADFQGTATFADSVEFADAAAFVGAANFGGVATFDGPADFAASATFAAPPIFNGATTFANPVEFVASPTFGGAVEFQRTATFADAVEFGDAASFAGDVDFGGAATFGGSASFVEIANFGDVATFNGPADFVASPTFAAPSSFNGAATFANPVEFVASATFGGTADFQGTATFADSVEFGDAASFVGAATFADGATFVKTARFDDAATFADVATFAEVASFAKSARFDGAAAFGNRVDFAESVAFNADATFANAATFGGGATFANPVAFNAATTFGGVSTAPSFAFAVQTTLNEARLGAAQATFPDGATVDGAGYCAFGGIVGTPQFLGQVQTADYGVVVDEPIAQYCPEIVRLGWWNRGGFSPKRRVLVERFFEADDEWRALGSAIDYFVATRTGVLPTAARYERERYRVWNGIEFFECVSTPLPAAPVVTLGDFNADDSTITATFRAVSYNSVSVKIEKGTIPNFWTGGFEDKDVDWRIFKNVTFTQNYAEIVAGDDYQPGEWSESLKTPAYRHVFTATDETEFYRARIENGRHTSGWINFEIADPRIEKDFFRAAIADVLPSSPKAYRNDALLLCAKIVDKNGGLTLRKNDVVNVSADMFRVLDSLAGDVWEPVVANLKHDLRNGILDAPQSVSTGNGTATKSYNFICQLDEVLNNSAGRYAIRLRFTLRNERVFAVVFRFYAS